MANRQLVSAATLILAICLICLTSGSLVAADRGLLGRVVQACVLTHRITSAAFPCLEVNTVKLPDGGFVVLRVPDEPTHIVVSPIEEIRGVEDERLQSLEAPNFFEDAWQARRYVNHRAARPIKREEIGLAINSQSGRSQDQLHIHIDCVRSDVRSALQTLAPKAGSLAGWTSIDLQRARYEVLWVRGEDLKGLNIFRLVASHLGLAPTQLGRMAIAVIAGTVRKAEGFYILARASSPAASATSEGLLDHSCAIAQFSLA